jgi:hypothetical protein
VHPFSPWSGLNIPGTLLNTFLTLSWTTCPFSRRFPGQCFFSTWLFAISLSASLIEAPASLHNIGVLHHRTSGFLYPVAIQRFSLPQEAPRPAPSRMLLRPKTYLSSSPLLYGLLTVWRRNRLAWLDRHSCLYVFNGWIIVFFERGGSWSLCVVLELRLPRPLDRRLVFGLQRPANASIGDCKRISEYLIKR